jgi:Flp pilus assembly protein TadG
MRTFNRSNIRKPSAYQQRGVAAVETALIGTFILVPLVLGMAEFGRAIFYYESLTKAARTAARYAVIHKLSRPTTYAAEANALARCGLTACAANIQANLLTAPGIAAADVTVTVPTPISIPVPTGAPVNSYGTADAVVVKITYNLPSLLGFKVGSLFNFGPISVIMMEPV